MRSSTTLTFDAMRASRYSIFVVFLALALSGSGFARAMSVGQPCISTAEMMDAHNADHADHQQHHGNQVNSLKQAAVDCWSMCASAASGILATPPHGVDMIVSSVVYSDVNPRLYGRWIPLDPGIPKYFS